MARTPLADVPLKRPDGKASVLRKRTDAERAAIDARCDAWPRRLSGTQRSALAAMTRGPLRFIRANGRWDVFTQATVNSLLRRRLCRIEGKQRPRAIITGAGRKELAHG